MGLVGQFLRRLVTGGGRGGGLPPRPLPPRGPRPREDPEGRRAAPPPLPPSPGEGARPGEPSAPLQIDPQADQLTEAAPDTATRSEPECQRCASCPPRTLGSSQARPAPQAGAGHQQGYAYQHFVCPWHWYLPATSMIEEWGFEGVSFDGLHPAECHLFEAKHGYHDFLRTDYTPTDLSDHGEPVLKDWAERAKIQETAFDPMINQARRQDAAIRPFEGDVRLSWVFSHQITLTYVSFMFFRNIENWYHTMEHRPFVQD